MTSATVEPHPGPSLAPASATGSGLVSSPCLHYRYYGPKPARIRIDPFWPERVVHRDDELIWAIFPAFDSVPSHVLDGFRSAGVALDLITEDGTRLLDVVTTEVDGTPAAPHARAMVDSPDQWNERRLTLQRIAGRRIVRAELVISPPPARSYPTGVLEGWIDAMCVEHARKAPAQRGPAERVVTTRGSHSSPSLSRGNTQPLTGVPHGGVFITPATDLSNPHWNYTWSAHGPGPNPRLAGMLLTRSPSIWIGDRGALAFRIGLSDGPEIPLTPAEFRHDDEQAQPYSYRVRTATGVVVAATASDHSALVEIDLPGRGRLEFCAPGSPLTHAAEHPGRNGTVELDFVSTVPSAHDDDPFCAYYSVVIEGFALATNAHGGMVSVASGAQDGQSLRIEVGTSLISAKQARRARLVGVAGRKFGAVADSARARWDEVIGIVSAPGARPDLQALVASDLYRMFLYPTTHYEECIDGPMYASGVYRRGPDSQLRTGRVVRRGRPLTNNGFWDTYRTTWPAYHLLVPARAGALLDGMLEHVRESGWSPRWTAGTPLDAMVGTSFDVICADAASSGIEGVDLELAYEAALRNATAASANPRFGRKGMPHCLTSGHVDASIPESVSWTAEGSINDAGAAILARTLLRSSRGERSQTLRVEARYLASRAFAYRALWDPATRFFRPRDADGSWADEPFDPRVWGGGHTETNAWGSLMCAPHDGHGLAALFGGPASMGDALDAYFTEAETGRAQFAGTYPQVIHEMVEARNVRQGMWGVSNQPAHHMPWMYAYTDRPWRMNDVLTDAALRLFRGAAIGQGFPGDEDNGEMSAWHLFTLLGLAPFQPGSGELLITAPVLDHATLRPLGAAPVTVRTHRQNPADHHIRDVTWRGRAWSLPSIPIRELHRGGTLEVTLGSEPAEWSEPVSPRPYFAPDDADGIDLTDAVTAYGRRGSTVSSLRYAPLRLDSGAELDIELVRRNGDSNAILTLTLARAGVHEFSVDAVTNGESTTLARHRGATWAWDAQLRPFSVALPRGAARLRLTWLSGASELLALQVLTDQAVVATRGESRIPAR